MKTENYYIEDGYPVCKKCLGLLGAVEYGWMSPNHYDGISEYVCEKCKIRIGRWSHKILKDNEEEKRYGKEN